MTIITFNAKNARATRRRLILDRLTVSMQSPTVSVNSPIADVYDEREIAEARALLEDLGLAR